MLDRENRACVGSALWGLHLLGRKSFFLEKCHCAMLITSYTGACQKEEEVLPLALFAFIKFVSVCMCNSVWAVYWDVCVQIHTSMHAEAREVSALPYYFTLPYSLESGSLGELGSQLAPEILLSLPHLQLQKPHLELQTMPGFFVVWFRRQGFSV